LEEIKKAVMPMQIGISLARQALCWLRITYKNVNLSDGVLK
jgi:hypothetical protein